MSRNSKAKRDAKRKKQPKRFSGNRPSKTAQVVAQLILDGEPFCAIGHSGSEWNLFTPDGVVAGADDFSTIWALVQAIAERAEENGNIVSLERDRKTDMLLQDRHEIESTGEIENLAAKVLTVYPLPSPPEKEASESLDVSLLQAAQNTSDE